MLSPVMHFSATCIRDPKCVFTPESADDVSEAVRVIGETRSPFAVIGGGHNTVEGAANIDYGVLISMARLDTLELVEKDAMQVRIGTGNLWKDAYKFAKDHGYAINGGRYGQIGVGGLTLGGGIGLFSSMLGFTADSVMEFELVLANGDLVVANHETRSDLFWALKGGTNWFGIVTRIDIETIKAPEGTWFGIKGWKWTQEVQEPWFDALAAYMVPGGGVEDTRATLMPVIQGFPAARFYGAGTIQFFAAPERHPEPFKDFENIEVDKLLHLGGIVPWTFFPFAPDFPMWVGFPRRLYWAVSFKPEREAICIANATIFSLAEEMVGHIPKCTVGITYQPISKDFLQASVNKGGNAISLTPEDGPLFGKSAS